MTQEFSLDQKKVTLLAALVLVLVLLVFIAGYLSGTIVGLPETEEQPVVSEPVKSRTKPPVVTMPVPPVEETSEFEEVAEVAEPEPEETEEIAEPEEAVPAEKLYSVQVGAFRTQARAEAHKQLLSAKGYQAYIYPGENSKGVLWHTLRIGDFEQVDDAITAAHEFRALEGSYVVLTHFDSLMMVRDDAGKRIEIVPPENTTPVSKTVEDEAEAEDGTDVSETVADELEEAVDEPEEAMDELEVAVDEPEEVADEPEVVADEPEAVADESEAVADEPEAVAEPSTPEPGTTGETSPEPSGDEPVSATGHRITFALPTETKMPPAEVDKETPDDKNEGVGSLIATAEASQYAVQVGAFLNRENAYAFAEKLKGRGYPAYVFHYTDTKGNAWNAVRAGDFPDPETAKSAAIEFEGKENITAIVTRIDAISMVYVK